MTRRILIPALFSLTLLGSCGGVTEPHLPSRPEVAQAKPAAATFVNKVWEVTASPDVAAGGLYTFLSTGTLVIVTPHGTPAFGEWAKKGSELSMTEEGISYRVEILNLTPDEFKIRIHNPGKPTEITFHPAAQTDHL